MLCNYAWKEFDSTLQPEGWQFFQVMSRVISVEDAQSCSIVCLWKKKKNISTSFGTGLLIKWTVFCLVSVSSIVLGQLYRWKHLPQMCELYSRLDELVICAESETDQVWNPASLQRPSFRTADIAWFCNSVFLDMAAFCCHVIYWFTLMNVIYCFGDVMYNLLLAIFFQDVELCMFWKSECITVDCFFTANNKEFFFSRVW